MKALMKMSIDEKQSIIDLTHYGHDEDISWNDLSEEDKCEIRDSISEQMVIMVTGEDYDN